MAQTEKLFKIARGFLLFFNPPLPLLKILATPLIDAPSRKRRFGKLAPMKNSSI